MTQGAENDLVDITYLTVETPVFYTRSNEPLTGLNTNILTVDNKAILARNTATTAQTDLDNHVGATGALVHAEATTGVAGFQSPSDKFKLNNIQNQAQLNILAPVDAIELISRKVTTLHEHPIATTALDGYMEQTDKVKLNGIQAGAQVTNITPGDAATLTGGGNADSLHGHGFSVGTEAFDAAAHLAKDHTGLPGITSFPGFEVSSFFPGPAQDGPGVTIFTQPYTTAKLGGVYTSIQVISTGFHEIFDYGTWGSEAFQVNDVSISGLNGVVTYEVVALAGPGDCFMRCWQVGYGPIV